MVEKLKGVKAFIIKKRKMLIILAATLLVLVPISVFAVVKTWQSETPRPSAASDEDSSTESKTPQTIAKDEPATATSPQPQSPASPKPPAAPLSSCKSKTSDSSFHSCAILATRAADLKITFSLSKPPTSSSYFVEWFGSDQITCTLISACTITETLPKKTTSQTDAILAKVSQAASITVKAKNYLTSTQCGTSCVTMLPRDHYRFNGFVMKNSTTLDLSYVYQCTDNYVSDPENQYPWLNGLKPSGCVAQ